MEQVPSPSNIKARFKGQSDAEWAHSLLNKTPELEEQHVPFVLWQEQFYLDAGRLPTFEESSDLGLSLDKWQQFWINRGVRQALTDKGIPLLIPTGEGVDYPIPSAVLSGRQLECINALLDVNDTRPDHKKLRDMGITSREFETWNSNRVFREYYEQRAKNLLERGSTDADRALLDNVRMGDLSAIKYFDEKTGRYRPHDPQIVNFTLLVNQIIEILAARLTPEMLKMVSADIKQSMAAQGLPTFSLPVGQQNSINTDTVSGQVVNEPGEF